MINREEQSDIEYMLSRCLGLWLTDLKPPIAKGLFTNAHLRSKRPDEHFTFYRPLALLIHAHRMLQNFSTSVIPYIANVANRLSNVYRKSETLERQENRMPQYKFKAADMEIFDFVANEFLEHCTQILSLFVLQKGGKRNIAALQLLNRFSFRLRRVKNLWSEASPFLNCSDSSKPDMIKKEILNWHRQLMEDSDKPNRGLRAGTSEALNMHLAELRVRARYALRLLSWRDKWTFSSSCLGRGGQYRFNQTRSNPGLFELWCFYELAYVMKMHHHSWLIQRSVLRGGGINESLFDGRFHAMYFDYYGNDSGFCPQTPILKNIHVEWFFRSFVTYEQSILMDTKYKRGTSLDFLKTLGYMSAYGIKNGIVVFRQPFKTKTLQDDSNETQLAYRFFGDMNDKCLASVQLVPREDNEKNNERLLEILLKDIIIPSAGIHIQGSDES